MGKTNLYDSILRPVITEKSTYLSEMSKVVFKVKKDANKKVRGKKVKVPGYKKAIVTLKKGQNIDLTTGI